MNTHPYNKLDAILALASVEYMKDVTNEFLTTTMDVELSVQTRHQIMRMIRKKEHQGTRQKAWKVCRGILVACLILATLALAACMAIPTIREAIWKVMLEWNDESVKIQFVPNDDPDYTTGVDPSETTANLPENSTVTEPEDEPDVPTVTPPTSIEEVNVPGYMPMGYTTKSSLESNNFQLLYYNANNTMEIIYRQAIIGYDTEGDGEGGIATELTVNGLNAVLFTYEGEDNIYNLYWQDNQYRYNIYGYFASYDDLIRMATSVAVK